jgi:hypothetical protein
MQLVSQEVGALSSSMAVVDGEKRTARPLLHLLELGLNNVEYDAYAIFVVVADHALMSVRSIRNDDAILFRCEFGRVVLLLELLYLLSFQLHVLTSLIQSHLHTTVVHNLPRISDLHLRLRRLFIVL